MTMKPVILAGTTVHVPEAVYFDLSKDLEFVRTVQAHTNKRIAKANAKYDALLVRLKEIWRMPHIDINNLSFKLDALNQLCSELFGDESLDWLSEGE
jgi:hypothetical protein